MHAGVRLRKESEAEATRKYALHQQNAQSDGTIIEQDAELFDDSKFLVQTGKVMSGLAVRLLTS